MRLALYKQIKTYKRACPAGGPYEQRWLML